MVKLHYRCNRCKFTWYEYAPRLTYETTAQQAALQTINAGRVCNCSKASPDFKYANGFGFAALIFAEDERT